MMNSDKYQAANDPDTSRPGVLIVDDDRDIVRALETLLELEGYDTVYSVSGVREARELLKQHPVDIALLDIRLDDGNGIDLVSAVKAACDDAVCIMMTAYRDEGYAVSAIKTGADDYLHKPMEPKELLDLIADHARRQASHRAQRKHVGWSRTIVDVTGHTYFIIDQAGTVVSANRQAIRLLQHEHERIIGKPLWALDCWQDEDRFPGHLKRVVQQAATGYRITSEVPLVASDGLECVYEMSIKVIDPEEGEGSHLLVEGTDITERKQAEQELEARANHDSLTALPNRTYFMRQLTQIIARAERQQRGLAVMFVDLDAFKPVNDTYGHEVGDMVLIEVADRLRRCLRTEDLVARYSGDEFTVALADLGNKSDANFVAGRIMEAMAEPVIINSSRLKVTCSIGIALYPENGANPEELIRYADTAMYEAKGNGRNQVYFFQQARR